MQATVGGGKDASRVRVLEFRVRVEGSGFRVRLYCSGFRVWGLGFGELRV